MTTQLRQPSRPLSSAVVVAPERITKRVPDPVAWQPHPEGWVMCPAPGFELTCSHSGCLLEDLPEAIWYLRRLNCLGKWVESVSETELDMVDARVAAYAAFGLLWVHLFSSKHRKHPVEILSSGRRLDPFRDPSVVRESLRPVCIVCNDLYRNHPVDTRFRNWDPGGDRWLRILCTGDLAKL